MKVPACGKADKMTAQEAIFQDGITTGRKNAMGFPAFRKKPKGSFFEPFSDFRGTGFAHNDLFGRLGLNVQTEFTAEIFSNVFNGFT